MCLQLSDFQNFGINLTCEDATMESLSELQNPLLGKTSRNVPPNNHHGYQCDYPSQPYQDSLIGFYGSEADGKHETQQFLDATSLHLAVEAFYRPGFVLCKDDASLHSKDSKSESFETTFTESKDVVLGGGSPGPPRDCGQGEKDVKIQTVSYEVEEEEQGPEYEVRDVPKNKTQYLQSVKENKGLRTRSDKGRSFKVNKSLPAMTTGI